MSSSTSSEVGPSKTKEWLYFVGSREVAISTGTIHMVLFSSFVPSAKKRCWLSFKMRLSSPSTRLSTLITGKPICLVQPDMMEPTGLLLASLSAAHKSSVNVFEYLCRVR